MREVKHSDLWLGEVPIEKISFNPKSRDDIPVILRAMQAVYVNERTRGELFELLDKHICPDTDRTVGRPGMEMWRMLLFALLYQGLRRDFDQVHELANEHSTLRRMLGHGAFDDYRYNLQSIMDNIGLIPPELLREVSRLVVEVGHGLVKKKPGEALLGRCDSFVVETDVHYPTDLNLLWDSLRCLIRYTSRECAECGVEGWRQHAHLTRKARRLFNRVSTSARWKRRAGAVEEYVDYARTLVARAEESVVGLVVLGNVRGIDRIRHFIGYARLLADQVERRVLKGEVIPQEEKVLSVFEPHTRWNNKGKAGGVVELGVPVCVLEDQHQFILDHMVMLKEQDVDVAVPVVAGCKEMYPDLKGCSFDRGFYSSANREALDGLLEINALPKKGKLNGAERMRESEEEFAAARRRHPAVESAINNLEHKGLGRVRLHGEEGFERAVAMAVVAANLHRVGRLLQQRERKKLRRRRRLQRAA